jgi:hypothetical protein
MIIFIAVWLVVGVLLMRWAWPSIAPWRNGEIVMFIEGNNSTLIQLFRQEDGSLLYTDVRIDGKPGTRILPADKRKCLRRLAPDAHEFIVARLARARGEVRHG